MSNVAYAMFKTPIGECALAWTDAGIVGLQLPEANAAATRKRLIDKCEGAAAQPPPKSIREAMRAILKLLNDGTDELAAIQLDLSRVTPFYRRVFAAARAIPAGMTLTYGELAGRLGDARAARAVGQAMARNPIPLIVPCHRVMAAGGKTGGFSAHGGAQTKLRLLRIEGASLQNLLTLG